MRKVLFIMSLFLLFASTIFSQVVTEKQLTIKPELDLSKIEAAIAKTATPLINVDCQCGKNLLADGGFQNVSIGGGSVPSNISSSSAPWKPGYNSPQWSGTLQPACDKGVISMWGNQVVGESIYQNGIPFIAGHSYKVKVTARFVNPTSLSTFVRLKLATYTGTGAPSTYDPPGLASPIINSSSWQTYSFSFTTGAANSISLHPENDYAKNDGAYVSWIQIDHICIEDECDKPTNTNINFSLTTVLGGGTTATASAIGASAALGNGWTLKEVVTGTLNPCKWIPGAIKWQSVGASINIPSGILVPGKCYVLTHYVNVLSTKWDPKQCLKYKAICFCVCDNSINVQPDPKPVPQNLMQKSAPNTEDEGILKEAEVIIDPNSGRG